jgi:predicted peptidase
MLSVVNAKPLKYLLYVPESYQAQTPMPLILFLHGSGERGDDPMQVMNYGLPRHLKTAQDFPFLVVMPQCPAETRWTVWLDALVTTLDAVMQQYAVDTRRVYLIGFSMGGEGTWKLAAHAPERFAAVAPVSPSGRTSLADVQNLVRREIAIWAFHGLKDARVPPSNTIRLVRELVDAGAEPNITLYPDADHNGMSDAPFDLRSPLYDWLMEQMS